MASTSLRELRRMVLRRFGDLITLTATAVGTTTTFIDANHVVGQPGRFAAREAYFTSGANAGQVRYVEASSRTTNELTFSTPLPVATQVGDELDLTNAYGVGSTFAAATDAVNWALRTSRTHALVPARYDVPDLFDPASPEIVVPDTMVGVEAVLLRRDSESPWRELQLSHELGGNGWSLDHYGHSVVVAGAEARRADGCELRVVGMAEPEELVDDDDTTTVDVEWLVDAATSHLALDTLLSRTNSQEWASKGMLYRENARALLPRITPNLAPSFQRF